MNNFDGRNIAYVSVWSDALNLDQLTEVLGLGPDRGWSIGDRFLRGTRELHRKETAWEICPAVTEGSSIEDQLNSLYARAEAPIRRLLPGSMNLGCRLQIVQTLTVRQLQSRGLNIDPKWVALLAAAGGSVDIDQYVLSGRDWRRFLRSDAVSARSAPSRD
jgi:hypothetical protein